MTDDLQNQPQTTPAFTALPAAEPVAEAQVAPATPTNEAAAVETVAAPAAPVVDAAPVAAPEPEEDFGDLLRAFEKSHSHRKEPGASQLQGTVVSLDADQVFVDIGFKTEGVLPRTAFKNNADEIKAGDQLTVSVKGRNTERYYELTLFKVAQPTDWTALEKAFNDKTAIVATVTGVVKGGLTVDVGVRAFMPASRSGERETAEMEKLVGTEITCRITKLDTADENVVVDRRIVLEEQSRAEAEVRFGTLEVGQTLEGTVRSLMPYGAFVDLGGMDGLLHVSDISWTRINKPEDVLEVGQAVKVRVLKIDPDTKKLSLGLKQLAPEPWQNVPGRFAEGQRVKGTVVRLTDFGAFVELEAGVEGLIHISEMAWNKKVRHPEDLVKVGEAVEAVILSIKPEERRIALGLKQTLADPWLEFQRNFPAGAQVEGAVTRMMNFGAFVQIADGVEGLVHISEIVTDRRLNHPSEALHTGEVVKAQVLAIDPEKRQVKLSIKQLVPTSLDEFIAESKVGDKVSGRVVEVAGQIAYIELGDGIRSTCPLKAAPVAEAAASEPAKAAPADLSALTSLLSARWKGNAPAAKAGPDPLSAGQIRSFKISKLDAEAKKVEVELV